MTPLCSFYSEEGQNFWEVTPPQLVVTINPDSFAFSLHIGQLTSYSHKQISPAQDNTYSNFWTLMTPWTLHLLPLSQCVPTVLAACAVSFLMTDTVLSCSTLDLSLCLAQGLWRAQDLQGYQERHRQKEEPALPISLTSCSTALCYRSIPSSIKWFSPKLRTNKSLSKPYILPYKTELSLRTATLSNFSE